MLPIDELNVLYAKVIEELRQNLMLYSLLVPTFESGDAEYYIQGEKVKKENLKRTAEETIEEYLVAGYFNGWEFVAEDTADLESGRAYETANAKTAGKTFKERVSEHIDKGIPGMILVVAETEFHRVFQTAERDAAKHGGLTEKTWHTMMDDRVRDTHQYLENVTVPIDDEFITYDGDSAQFPGGFLTVENNANCRCYLTYS